ncbi:cbb3-type cytochrome oxidase assembly protein CcoS [Helicobacter didelphidarum]|uniref:Cbb3-type cytochrome oxidase assembly protein CcoS n=1 Tax=Helicobacter didelphidarum TaxID=2040648 RepID=A0A3D8IPB9_9HELI|nr:NAD(P)-binding domain-containing protein [Helicobacter didelphidarum]RDU67089.1 cbb3-type cytochrome oxidase assembly protein CcoS [Helicobacter didelphidarum]
MQKYDVVIAGAGPGGISSAIECVKMGVKKVALLEKTDGILAMIREYYKAGKRVDKDYKGQVVDLKGHIPFTDSNKEATIELFMNLLKENNIEVFYNHEVDRISKENNSFITRTTNNDVFQSQFAIVGIGKMGKPNKPSYPLPMSLRKKINFNINDCVAGEKILVVGGGNSAVEYAIHLAGMATTTLNYRRKEFTRINDENARELEKSLQNGLESKFGIDIISVVDDNSQLKVTFSDESTQVFDRIVYAIGGVAPVDFLKKCGIQVDSNGCALCNEHKESNISNLFVVGDILFKNGGSIGLSMNDSYVIATTIAERL